MNVDSETQILGGGNSGFGGGIFEGLILGALLGGNGFGGNNRNDGALVTQNAILEQTIASQAALSNATLGIAGSINNLESNLLAGQAELKSTQNIIGSQLAQAIVGVGTQVQENKYDMALQMCNQTNLLTAQMNNGFQEIKDAMSCQVVKDLERQLAVAENGGPRVRAGAFVDANPCHDNARITNVEQTIVQVGNALSAIQGALATK